MKFKQLEVGDRFTVPTRKNDSTNLPGQYGIKLSDMVYEVRSGNENPQIIKDSPNSYTTSRPTYIDTECEVQVMPKMEKSFNHNNCLPVVTQQVWFYDEHIGGSPSMYCNVRSGIIFKMFQEMCDILEPCGNIITIHTSAVYDHRPEIKEEQVEDFWATYPKKVLV